MLDEAYNSIAARTLQGELLESLVRIQTALGWHALPRAVGSKLPREDVIGKPDLEDLGETAAQLGIRDGSHRFDAAVEVALHHVRRAQVPIWLAAAAETENARVLQEPADDGTHPDALRQTGHPWPKRTHAADDEVDLRARLRGRVEPIDDVWVDEVVDLDRDAAAGLRLALDQLHDSRPQARRGDEQLAIAVLAAVSREEVEELGDVGADVGVRRQQAHVLVAMSSARVVVARADVDIVLDAVAFAAHNQCHLGVGLQADQSIDHVDVGLFECSGPGDVRLLIASS